MQDHASSGNAPARETPKAPRTCPLVHERHRPADTNRPTAPAKISESHAIEIRAHIADITTGLAAINRRTTGACAPDWRMPAEGLIIFSGMLGAASVCKVPLSGSTEARTRADPSGPTPRPPPTAGQLSHTRSKQQTHRAHQRPTGSNLPAPADLDACRVSYE